MDVVKYFEEKKRMLDSIGRKSRRCDGLDCYDCPFSRFNNKRKLQCSVFESEYPEEAVAIVEKWAAEHPQKTIFQDFLEKYPNAPISPDGTPNTCPFRLGYEEKGKCTTLSCINCWNRPIERNERR